MGPYSISSSIIWYWLCAAVLDVGTSKTFALYGICGIVDAGPDNGLGKKCRGWPVDAIGSVIAGLVRLTWL